MLVAGGWSFLLLALWYQVIDVWGLRNWSTIFVGVGANAITLYFLNNLMNLERFAVRFVGGDVGVLLDRFVSPGTGRFVSHALALAFAIVLAGFLYRRKIFLRV